MLQVDFKIGKEEDPSVAKMLEHAVVTMFIVDSMIDVKNYKSPFISRTQDDFFSVQYGNRRTAIRYIKHDYNKINDLDIFDNNKDKGLDNKSLYLETLSNIKMNF